MKIYIICCVPAQILYWGFSKINQWNSLIFVCWCKFAKLKSWLNIFWLGMVKNGCCEFGLWTLKLTLFEEWTDGINWFFACCYKFMQIRMCLKIFGVGMVKKWLWQVWSWYSEIDCISKMNRWNKLIFCMLIQNPGKLKVNNSWVGLVKNGHGLLVPEALKSAVF